MDREIERESQESKERHYTIVHGLVGDQLYMVHKALENYALVLKEYSLPYSLDGVRAGLEAAITSFARLPKAGPLPDDYIIAIAHVPGKEDTYTHVDCVRQKKLFGDQTFDVLVRLEIGDVFYPDSHDGYVPGKEHTWVGGKYHLFIPERTDCSVWRDGA